MITRTDALLWSINERLGALLNLSGAEAGSSIPPMSAGFLDDLMDMEDMQEESDPEGGANFHDAMGF